MVSWAIESSIDKDYIYEVAETMGWYDDPPKVQVKRYLGMEAWYVIEPYEEDCHCPNLIHPPTERPSKRRNVG